MDKNYFFDIGRRVAWELIEALKAPPVGHPFYGNQFVGFSTGTSDSAPRTVSEGSNDSKDNLSTTRPDRLPKISIGDAVTINGNSGIVTKVNSQKRKYQVQQDDTKVDSPMVNKEYTVTSVTIRNSWAQESRYQFGGLDYAFGRKSSDPNNNDQDETRKK